MMLSEQRTEPGRLPSELERLRSRIRSSVKAMQASGRPRDAEEAGGTSARRLADVGYPRAFYSVKAGLVSASYLSQRCEEELYRLGRYDSPFSLLFISAPKLEDEVVAWARVGLRKMDLFGYVGSGCYAAFLPSTDRDAAMRMAARLRAVVPDADASASTCPEDGRSFNELLDAARSRVSGAAATQSPSPRWSRLSQMREQRFAA